MRPILALVGAALLCAPGAAHAVSAAACSTAVDFPAADVVSFTQTEGDPSMLDVVSGLGAFLPYAADLCLLSTGLAETVTSMEDYDQPGPTIGESGDRVTLEWVLQAPSWANSFMIRTAFFSREYPEWVGSEYNDTLELWLSGSAWSGQMLYDAVGNPVAINSVLFNVTSPAALAGTGFDADGGTGWLVASAPVQGGTQITLSVSLYDVGDGVWDSAALFDYFTWSSTSVTEPYTAHADEEGFPIGGGVPPNVPAAPQIGYASPKVLPLTSPPPVLVTGAAFTPDMQVWVDELAVDFELLSPGLIQLLDLPDADAFSRPGGGPVDLRVQRGSAETTLSAAMTYADMQEPHLPRIDSLTPGMLPPGGGVVTLRGTGLDVFSFSLEDLEGTEAAAPETVELRREDGVVTELDLLLVDLEPGWFLLRADADPLESRVLPLSVARSTTPSIEEEPAGCSQSPAPAAPWVLLLLAGTLLRRRAGR